MTRISIIHIVCGYLLDFIGCGSNPSMIIMVCILVTVGYYIANLFAKCKYKSDKFIEYDELVKRVEVDTIATFSEIDEMMKDVYKDE